MKFHQRGKIRGTLITCHIAARKRSCMLNEVSKIVCDVWKTRIAYFLITQRCFH